MGEGESSNRASGSPRPLALDRWRCVQSRSRQPARFLDAFRPQELLETRLLQIQVINHFGGCL